jgi:glycosyltransferase involved in cell wall biosynthesis
VYDEAVPEPVGVQDPASPSPAAATPDRTPLTAASSDAATSADVGEDARVGALSWFFPAHNEAENIELLVVEALAELPRLARTFEIICVDDGSTDGTAALADDLAANHPGIVRAVHHPVNRGYGAALRSGLAASRYPLVCFTDGDRQFRVADLSLLLDRLARPPGRGGDRTPDVVAGYRQRRADATVRLVYARIYRLCLRLFFGLDVRDVDCACKLFRREALEDIRLVSGGAFLSAELLIKLQARGYRIVEVGVPHYPRTAGRASGANPRVILRAVRDFWRLRLLLWLRRGEALERGEPVLASGPGSSSGTATR